MFFRRCRNWLYYVPFVFVMDGYAENTNEVSVGVTTEWTDNVGKSSGVKQDDIITNLILGVNLDGDDSFYQYGMDYTLSHENYMDDSFDDANYWSGQAYFNVLALQDRLRWSNRIGSTVTERNSQRSDTPDNRDQRNNISSTLDFYLLNSLRDRVYATGQVSRVTYREATDNNSDRYAGNLSWDHSFNTLTSGGVSCGTEVVEFKDSETINDYDAYDCKLTVSRRLKDGNAIGQLGSKNIDREDGFSDSNMEYYFRVGWEPGPHRLYVMTKRDFTDTTIGFTQSAFSDTVVNSSEQIENPVNSTLDVNSDNVATTIRTRTEVGYGLKISPTFQVNTRLFRDNDDREERENVRLGEQKDYDVLREGLGFNINKNLPRHSKIGFNYRYERRENTSVDLSPLNEDVTTIVVDYYNVYTVRYTKLFSQQLQVDAWISGDEKRNKDDSLEYDAYSVAASVLYTF